MENLQNLLGGMYEELSRLPERDYALSREAKTLFQAWNHNLVTAEMDESHFGMSLVYAKIESYTARIALWLHIINHLLGRQSAPPIISGETMQAAIEIASFYLWQHRFIQAHNSPNRKLEGIYLKVQLQAEKLLERAGKGVNASYVKTRLNALKKWSVEKIRNNIFVPLAASGLGRTEGEGSNMIYIPFGEEGENKETTKNPNTPFSPQPVGGLGDELVNPPITESYAFQAVQTTVGGVDGEGRSGNPTMPNHHVGGNKNHFNPQTKNNIPTNFSDQSMEKADSISNIPDSLSSVHNLTTNNTNSPAQPVVSSTDPALGAPHQHHHQPPIDERQINLQEEVGRRQVEVFDFNYVVEQLDRHIQRVGGTIDYWKNYLREKYNVASRRHLSDQQIIEFWDYLRCLPAKFGENL